MAIFAFTTESSQQWKNLHPTPMPDQPAQPHSVLAYPALCLGNFHKNCRCRFAFMMRLFAFHDETRLRPRFVANLPGNIH
jgi:hypothetical protein